MAVLAVPRPVFATSALAAAILALVCPLVAYLLPTGSGEGGFARAFTDLAVAMASVDLLMVTWAGLAAASRRRRTNGDKEGKRGHGLKRTGKTRRAKRGHRAFRREGQNGDIGGQNGDIRFSTVVRGATEPMTVVTKCHVPVFPSSRFFPIVTKRHVPVFPPYVPVFPPRFFPPEDRAGAGLGSGAGCVERKAA